MIRAYALAFEAVEQQRGQHEVAEVVDREGHLQALCGLAARAQDQPGVVDQYVEPVKATEQLRRERLDARRRREVERQAVHVLVGPALADLAERVGAAVRVARGEDHRRPERRQPNRRLFADPRVPAGDYDYFSTHRRRLAHARAHTTGASPGLRRSVQHLRPLVSPAKEKRQPPARLGECS